MLELENRGSKSSLFITIYAPYFFSLPGSILLQFTDGYFNDNLQSTIGVDFKIKVMEASGPDGRKKKIKVTIWDTAGQVRTYLNFSEHIPHL